MADEVASYREKLIETAIEQDEALLEAYFEGNEPSAEQIKACVRKGTLAGEFVPVFCGSAFKNKGVQPLLDAVVDFMPSPLDVPAVEGVDIKDSTVEVIRKPDDAEPLRRLLSKSCPTSMEPTPLRGSIPGRSKRVTRWSTQPWQKAAHRADC